MFLPVGHLSKSITNFKLIPGIDRNENVAFSCKY